MRAPIVRTMTILALTALAPPAVAQDFPARPAPPAFPALPAFPAFELEQLQQRAPRPPQPPQAPRPPRQRGPETTENFSQTIRISGNGIVDIQNLAGDIVITGGGGNSVQVEAVKRAFGPSEDERRRRLGLVQIEVQGQGGRVDVRTRYPQNMRNVNVVVDYTIALPQDSSVSVRTLSGDVRASNVRGELSVDTASGDIGVTSARRLGQLKTLSGTITLTNVETDEDVALNTLSGDLIGQNVRARSLSFTSVSGDLMLTDVQTNRANLRTVNGDVTYTGQLQRNGRYEVNTHSGDITMRVAVDGFNLEASTFNGEIRSDYAVTIGGAGGAQPRRRGPGSAIRGMFGDGGTVLDLRSFNGDIAITRR